MSAAPLSLVSIALAGFAVAGVAAALRGRGGLGFTYVACAAAAAVALIGHGLALFAASPSTASLPIGLPGQPMQVRLDALSAFFGVVVNSGVLAASLWARALASEGRTSRRVEPAYCVFVLAMNAVLLADDAFGFLLCWEAMSVASWLLVLAHHRDAANRRAAHLYLVVAGLGTFALLLGFWALAASAGSLEFDAMRAAQSNAAPIGLVLFAVLVGVGSKAGIMPLHAWLPLAHPAAPAHVSALMSGVMTKIAVYALLRLLFDLMGPPAWWWSLPLILLGAASAVLGLLHAVFDDDLKRILAWSTIENLGIVFTGVGLALAFRATGLDAAAALAMAAALLHVLNHAWFKTLLFLGAGSVVHATGHRNLDQLGGLVHRMPQTAAFFLVGALAIAALPPLNGFVSEWLLFQAVLAGTAFPETLLKFLTPALGAALALAAALAAACFVRVFGLVFLGRARSPAAASASEAAPAQRHAMLLLAALCVLGGLAGGASMHALGPVLELVVDRSPPGLSNSPSPFALVAFDAARSTYDAPTIMAFVIVSALLAAALMRRLAVQRTRRAAAWDCGRPEPSPLAQPSASGFSQPLRRIYGTSLFAAHDTVRMPPPGDARPARFAVHLKDPQWEAFYAAPGRMLERLSRWADRSADLTIRRYLVAVFLTLIALLLAIAAWAG